VAATEGAGHVIAQAEAVQMAALGAIVLAAHVGGKICHRLRLSEVTGQILGGALVGPYVLHAVGILGEGQTLYDEAIGAFHFFIFVFLSMVAFGIGEELHLSRLRRVGKSALAVVGMHAVVTSALVGGAFLLFSGLSTMECLLVACLAVAPAPAVAFVLMNRLRVEGRLRQMTGSVVVMTDLVQVLIFSILAQLAIPRGDETGPAGIAATVSGELVLAVLLGVAVYACLRMLVRQDATSLLDEDETARIGPESDFLRRMLAEHPSPSAEVLLVVLGTVSIGAGVAHYFGLPFLVTAIVAGVLASNMHSQAIFDSLKIEGITPVLNLGFFALVGASISFAEGAWEALGLAALYVGTRLAGTLLGVWGGCRIAGEDRKITACLPALMLPQAGVAAVEAVYISSVLGAPQIGTVILSGIIFFEIAGVYLADRNLQRWRSWVPDEERALEEGREHGKLEADELLLRSLGPDRVMLDVRAGTKPELLTALVDRAVATAEEPIDRGQALQVIGEREALAPTSLGEGVAVPHCRLMGVGHPVVVLARHAEGIVFGGVDDQPCRIILLMLSSARDPGAHLRLLAAAGHLLSDPATRERLLQAEDEQTVLASLRKRAKEG
jgi:PTS system nitrogen regulatory IIA component